MNLDESQLPAGTHTTILTGHDIVTGETLAYPIVWADRPYDTCPRCGQPVDSLMENCPVLLNTGAGQGGQIEEWSKQHGCGEWLFVDWQALPEDATGDDVLTAARALSDQRQAEITTARLRIESSLRADLAAALTRLAEPLEVGETAEDRADEIANGSEVEPGVCRDGDTWIAWAYGPIDDGNPVTVYAEDLTEAARG